MSLIQQLNDIEQLLNELYPKCNFDLTLLTEKDNLGLLGELFWYKLLKSIEKRFRLKVSWKGVQSYNKKNPNELRRGIDFKIRRDNKFFAGIEVKNPNIPAEPYSYLALANRDVNDRFKEIKPEHKLLSISKFDVYSDRIQQNLIANNMEIFELGRVITLADFKDLTYFNAKRDELIEFISNLIKKDTLEDIEKDNRRQEYLNSLCYQSSIKYIDGNYLIKNDGIITLGKYLSINNNGNEGNNKINLSINELPDTPLSNSVIYVANTQIFSSKLEDG
jgi:hypothetical protein